MQQTVNTHVNPITVHLNDSNTDGSFTVANSNSFLCPQEILSTAQENKYFGTL